MYKSKLRPTDSFCCDIAPSLHSLQHGIVIMPNMGTILDNFISPFLHYLSTADSNGQSMIRWPKEIYEPEKTRK